MSYSRSKSRGGRCNFCEHFGSVTSLHSLTKIFFFSEYFSSKKKKNLPKKSEHFVIFLLPKIKNK